MQLDIHKNGLQLVFFGSLLFLIGLLEGALISTFLNPRMALSAHLAAVQSGMALMIFGTIWQLVILEGHLEKIARHSGIWSMYLIWAAITIAALNGASRALPIAGTGHAASEYGELAVQVVVYIGAGLGVVSALLIVLGLSRQLRQMQNKDQ